MYGGVVVQIVVYELFICYKSYFCMYEKVIIVQIVVGFVVLGMVVGFFGGIIIMVIVVVFVVWEDLVVNGGIIVVMNVVNIVVQFVMCFDIKVVVIGGVIYLCSYELVGFFVEQLL